jgi:hypothetical protein
MTEPSITAAELASLQAELSQVATSLAAIPAVGGTVWNRSVVTPGDGIHTKPSEVAAGTIVGNIYAQIPPAIAQALVGQPIPVATWWFVGDDQNTLNAGDKLTSVLSPTVFVFTVIGVNVQPGYIVAGLSRINARQL